MYNKTVSLEVVLHGLENHRIKLGFILARNDKETMNNYILIHMIAFAIPHTITWNPWDELADYDYGKFRLMSTEVDGSALKDMLLAWNKNRNYKLSPELDILFGDRAIKTWKTLPIEPGSHYSSNTLANYGAVQYIYSYSESSQIINNLEFVAPHVPYFPSVASAIENVFSPSSLFNGVGIELTILDNSAHISSVHVSREYTTVMIEGVLNANGAYEVKVYGDNRFTATVPVTTDVPCKIEWNEIPNHVIWVLTTGNTIIDKREYNRQRSFSNSQITEEIDRTMIEDWIEAGEGPNIEYKLKIGKEENFTETVSAYANTNDGVILIGVKDDGQIVGIPSNPNLESTITDMIVNSLRPTPQFTVDIHNLNQGLCVVIVRIKKGTNRPYFINSGKPLAFLRHGSNDYAAQPEALKRMVMEDNPR